MLELTADQVAAIDSQKPTPLQLVNPATDEVYVLIRRDVYDLTCQIVGGSKGGVWADDADEDLIADSVDLRKRA